MTSFNVAETSAAQGNYTLKVHRLGEFHPQLRLSRAHEGQDIGDPLYGNVGGQDEKVGCLPYTFLSIESALLHQGQSCIPFFSMEASSRAAAAEPLSIMFVRTMWHFMSKLQA